MKLFKNIMSSSGIGLIMVTAAGGGIFVATLSVCLLCWLGSDASIL